LVKICFQHLWINSILAAQSQAHLAHSSQRDGHVVVVSHVHRRQQTTARLLPFDHNAGSNVWIAWDSAGKVLQPDGLDLQANTPRHMSAQPSVARLATRHSCPRHLDRLCHSHCYWSNDAVDA
jgi:hypothetical protein